MREKISKLNDVIKMLLAMLLGAMVGLIIGEPAAKLQFIGDIWLNIMKMFLVPIVVCMLVKGICTLENPGAFRRIGIRFIAVYAFTTVLAVLLAITITSVSGIGHNFIFEKQTHDVVLAEIPSFVEYLKSLFSSNVFKTFSEGNVIQVIVISCFMGIAILQLPEGRREPVRDWFFAMTDMMISLVKIALKLAPIGGFSLMASGMGKYGVSMLLTIARILIAFYVICLIHLILVDCIPLQVITGVKPLAFLKKMLPILAVASSTCSSNATIPVSMRTATESFGIQDSVAGLGVTFGSTIHKDGTAILCGIVMVFSSQAMGIPLTMGRILNLVFVTLMITSANGGLPGGGIMNMIMVAAAVGIPLDIVMIVGGFYRLFDIGTTSVNCLGDISATIIIDRLERRRTDRKEDLSHGGNAISLSTKF